VEEDVLRFEVSVQNVVVVHVLDRVADLSHHASDLLLREPAFSLEVLVEGAR
jgi:hypothetical protein